MCEFNEMLYVYIDYLDGLDSFPYGRSCIDECLFYLRYCKLFMDEYMTPYYFLQKDSTDMLAEKHKELH